MRKTWSTEQRRWLTVLLSTAIILGLTVSAGAQSPSCTTLGPQCAPATFGDDGEFQLGAIAKCCARQVVSHGIIPLCGGGNYCPNGTVTREQMGVFLWNAFLTSNPCTASCS